MHDKVFIHGSQETVLSPASLKIQPIKRTSPSLAETMRQCLVKAGLSNADSSNDYALSHPSAWLGNAYHKVLEQAPAAGSSDKDLVSKVEEVWGNAIQAQCGKNQDHELNRRFAEPLNWPKYTLIKAVAQIRAEELNAGLGDANGSDSESGSASSAPFREARLETPDGKLVGKPDLVSTDEICDYKSGNIYEDGPGSEDSNLKAAYSRQIKIYGHLVKVNRGYLPARGVVMPSSGQSEVVELTVAECENEVQAAIDLLDDYNEKLASGAGPLDLASPSPDACNWCEFKHICPAFWDNCTPDWASKIWGAAISGELAADPETIHNGDALAIDVAVDHGTIEGGQVRISPLPVSIFERVRGLKAGTRVQVTSLLVRPDGSVRPFERTLIISENDLPEILVEP